MVLYNQNIKGCVLLCFTCIILDPITYHADSWSYVQYGRTRPRRLPQKWGGFWRTGARKKNAIWHCKIFLDHVLEINVVGHFCFFLAICPITFGIQKQKNILNGRRTVQNVRTEDQKNTEDTGETRPLTGRYNVQYLFYFYMCTVPSTMYSSGGAYIIFPKIKYLVEF